MLAQQVLSPLVVVMLNGRNEIRACKELTDKPFGVNLMLMAPNKDELVDIIIEEKPAFVTLGAGNPVPVYQTTPRGWYQSYSCSPFP